VPRHSTGIHDPLECAALYLRTTSGSALFLANDLIYFTRDFALGVRQRIADETSLPLAAILVAATHTHSVPVVPFFIRTATMGWLPMLRPRLPTDRKLDFQGDRIWEGFISVALLIVWIRWLSTKSSSLPRY
jgi:hypothetical protein